MKASEARKKSRDVIESLVAIESALIKQEVEKAARRGQFSIFADSLHPETRTALELDGYTIKQDETTDVRGEPYSSGWVIEW